jgi:hypothetical protein
MLAPDRRRILNRQAELFEVLSDRLRWPDIPYDARRAVTELLARILNQHRLQGTAVQEEEHE